MLAGCATPPHDPVARAAFEQTNDPLEPMNRKILDLNLFLDRILLKPVTKVYIAVLPEAGPRRLHRALDNMKEPVVLINNMLQGRPEHAGIAAGRFVVNTTLGLAGLFDVAKTWGLDKDTGDFGQTLFILGLPEGPYLILPVLGPSNPRDAVGMGMDSYSTRSAIWPPCRASTIFRSPGMSSTASISAPGSSTCSTICRRTRSISTPQLRSPVQQHRAAELRHGAAAQPGANFYDIRREVAVADPTSSRAAPPAPSGARSPRP